MTSRFHKELIRKGVQYIKSGGCTCGNYYRLNGKVGTLTIRKMNKEENSRCVGVSRSAQRCKILWIVYVDRELKGKLEENYQNTPSFSAALQWVEEMGFEFEN